jgi:hypothetical protein
MDTTIEEEEGNEILEDLEKLAKENQPTGEAVYDSKMLIDVIE